MPAMNDGAECAVSGVRKPPRNEPAGYGGWKCRALCYGDLVDTEGMSERSQRGRARTMARLAGNKSRG